jgi:hypothetical protein
MMLTDGGGDSGVQHPNGDLTIPTTKFHGFGCVALLVT